uniref:Putative ovule protein n=1 Tax=Solanum chacoense TaxID=4108 RepID=A0A0V0H2K2_SOLCH
MRKLLPVDSGSSSTKNFLSNLKQSAVALAISLSKKKEFPLELQEFYVNFPNLLVETSSLSVNNWTLNSLSSTIMQVINQLIRKFWKICIRRVFLRTIRCGW